MIPRWACAAAAIALTAQPLPVFAQTSGSYSTENEQEAAFRQDLDAFVSKSLARFNKVPGLAVAVTRDDHAIVTNGWGKADLERGTDATAETRYYIASTTKAFVGTALALLDARGEVDLDWTLQELAPDVAFADGIPAERITLRHLVSLQHGLNNEEIPFRLAFTGQADPEILWSLLPELKPNNDQPLGTFRYDNLGFNLATLLVERRIGRSWQAILEEEVLGPLGLDQTHARGLEQAHQIASFAMPYDSLHPNGTQRLYLEKHDDTMQSAGGLYSSATDMAKWLQLQLQARKGTARSPLGMAAAKAHQPRSEFDGNFGPFISRRGYGLGWYSGPFENGTLYHAFGSFSGMRSHSSFLPKHNLGVSVTVNDAGTGFLLADIIAIYAYHWFTRGPQEAAEVAGQSLDMLEQRSSKMIERTQSDLESRGARVWQLSLPFAAYAGRYCNAAMGEITIAATRESSGLLMQFGRLAAELEPFTRPNAARAEYIPGSGQVIAFQVENGVVSGLTLQDKPYERCVF